MLAGVCFTALAAIGIIIAVFRIKKNKKRNTVHITNKNCHPLLPISYIILDKTRNAINTCEPVKIKKKCVFYDVVSGVRYEVKMKNSASIGRAKKNEIRLKERTVAHIHSILTIEKGQIYIEDNETINGTIVNGIRIKEKIPLFSGDFILIGDIELMCEINQ